MKLLLSFFCLFVLFCFSTYALAEPYVSTTFPSLAIIRKQRWQSENVTPSEFLGKIKDPEGGYFVYYQLANGDVVKVSIIMLDTNIWIIDKAVGFPYPPK